ncbi:PLP-dependent aminotransferase family protein [Bacillus alkalicellulosilyticus]|uniref:aminotransferase-like domain-containing protein n=1 Tax=Alkalihalobacterium alkalicellulosilyticum TaxID=1912214 RepID=UPI0009970116|nr:PLP-dependent aminotransferase family protein [Bacillus alkalicellulosilyticus]
MGTSKKRNDHLFIQIYDYVLQRIESKDWLEHEKLPSIRQLAIEFQVHRLTVLKAYTMLKNDNKIYVKDKVGYFVQVQARTQPSFPLSGSPLITAYEHKSSLSEIHQTKVDYNFAQALIDPNLLPNHFFSDYVKNVFDLYPKLLATYATVKGDEELRASLAHYLSTQYKTELNQEELLVLSGSQQGIYLVAQTFIKPRDTVLFERPSYSAAIDVFKARGAHIQTVTITPEGYDLNEVEYAMKTWKPRLFYLNPTFQNPTGYTIPVNQRKELVQLAEQYRCLLVEDDAYHDIYFKKAPPPPLYTFDTTGTVIYIRSFCKYISPGLRVAAIVCQHSLMKPLVSSKALIDNGSPLLNQKIFLHYFSSPRLQTHIEKLRIALQIRKEIMEEELAITDWSWVSPSGGLNIWARLPGTERGKLLFNKALSHSISFVPGFVCDPENQLSSWVRLSYSFANDQQIREGMKKLIQLERSF